MNACAGETCPLCGGRGEPFEATDYRECRNGHAPILLSWPWPDSRSLALWYAGGAFHEEQQLTEGLLPFTDPARDSEFRTAARARLAHLLPFIPPAGQRWLDLGAGTGALGEEATKAGYDAYGLEPCAALVDFARARGRRLELGDWRAASGEWDLISLIDVIEHLPDLTECLERLRTLLALAGHLLAEMPEAYAPRGDWRRHLRPQQHLCLFSRPAAEELFARFGWIVEAFHRPRRGELAKASWLLQLDPDDGRTTAAQEFARATQGIDRFAGEWSEFLLSA